MAITKPYTFQAGTKARASEVNQDFDILYAEANRLGTEMLNIDIEIQNVAEGKADINGDAGQVFKMADAVDSYDGVNKHFLENSIANVRDYISGYVITKNSNNSIRVSSGSCYDSTFTTIINSTGNITKENLNQTAGSTYYIYVIGDNSGYNIDILISQSGINPPLPSGYTLFRQIGRYNTDSNNRITSVIYYGAQSNSPSPKATIIETYQSGDSWYRWWSDGYLEQGGITGSAPGRVPARTVTFLKPFNGFINIVTNGAFGGSVNNPYMSFFQITEVTSNNFTAYARCDENISMYWVARGYA